MARIWAFECPGCGDWHFVHEGRWTFNGDPDRPTFTPSILIKRPWDNVNDDGKQHVCHSFVTDGRIQFLADCTHRLAGQTVELPEV